MALENLAGVDKFIDDLIITNPTGTDGKNQGDDHLRGIKNVLKNTFPNLTGAVTATQENLNLLTGATLASAGTVIDNFPTGTALMFAQAAAPTGWTQVVTETDRMLRLVSGAGGGVGGTDSAILMNKVPSHTHTFSTSSNGSHTHDLYSGIGTGAWNSIGDADGNAQQYKDTTTSAGAHTHTGTTATNGSASNWTPKYIDMIHCTKAAA